jgi:hypothetical protein
MTFHGIALTTDVKPKKSHMNVKGSEQFEAIVEKLESRSYRGISKSLQEFNHPERLGLYQKFERLMGIIIDRMMSLIEAAERHLTDETIHDDGEELAKIMNEIEGEDENDEKARQKHEESEMVRKLLAKQTEQMDVINQQRQQQQDSMNQLQYLKSQNEALMEKVDHPDQTLIEDLMKKQNESAEAVKQMMENDETAGMKAETEEMKAKQEQIYNEMMRKQKEQ